MGTKQQQQMQNKHELVYVVQEEDNGEGQEVHHQQQGEVVDEGSEEKHEQEGEEHGEMGADDQIPPHQEGDEDQDQLLQQVQQQFSYPVGDYVCLNRQTHMLTLDEDKLRLIDEFEQRPWLWDPAQKTNKVSRAEVLQEVAEAMSLPGRPITPKMVNDTWRALRDYFHKLQHRQEAIKWKFFERMSFLLGVQSVPIKYETMGEVVNEDGTIVLVETVDSKHGILNASSAGRARKRPRRSTPGGGNTEMLGYVENGDSSAADYMTTFGGGGGTSSSKRGLSTSSQLFSSGGWDDGSSVEALTELSEPFVIQVAQTYRDLASVDRQLALRFKRRVSNMCFDFEDEMGQKIVDVGGGGGEQIFPINTKMDQQTKRRMQHQAGTAELLLANCGGAAYGNAASNGGGRAGNSVEQSSQQHQPNNRYSAGY